MVEGRDALGGSMSALSFWTADMDERDARQGTEGSGHGNAWWQGKGIYMMYDCHYSTVIRDLSKNRTCLLPFSAVGSRTSPYYLLC